MYADWNRIAECGPIFLFSSPFFSLCIHFTLGADSSRSYVWMILNPLVCACVRAFLVTALNEAHFQINVYVTGWLMFFDLKCHFALHRWMAKKKMILFIICLEVRARHALILRMNHSVGYRNNRFSIPFGRFHLALSHRMAERPTEKRDRRRRGQQIIEKEGERVRESVCEREREIESALRGFFFWRFENWTNVAAAAFVLFWFNFSCYSFRLIFASIGMLTAETRTRSPLSIRTVAKPESRSVWASAAYISFSSGLKRGQWHHHRHRICRESARDREYASLRRIAWICSRIQNSRSFVLCYCLFLFGSHV